MLINLAIGLPTILLCLVLQAAFTFWSVRYYISQSNARRLRTPARPDPLAAGRDARAGAGQLPPDHDLGIAVHGAGRVRRVVRGGVPLCSELQFVGHGDVVMTKPWKLLGPLEAGNGVLMFGLTGAALMAMLQQMIKAQAEKGRPE